ncbi:MAG TPA: MarR family transcriptional regulator [Rudaea sp.]|nr:MarR family transcriptional regulator [Rudaea sp.]
MLDDDRYAALSEFRFRLTQFLRFSEQAARGVGISPLQYLLLLHLRGRGATGHASVGELAERLGASHQGTVALVKRCETLGLVRKRRSAVDARRVEVRLSARAHRIVARIAARHVRELERLDDVMRVARVTDLSPGKRAGARRQHEP